MESQHPQRMMNLKEQMKKTEFLEDVWKAVHTGDLAMLQKLLESDKKLVNSKSAYGRTPLMGAAQEGNTEMIELLLKLGANPNLQDTSGSTALMLASSNGKTGVALALLAAGVDINFQCSKGGTALMAAAAWGHFELVKLFLERGADPYLRDCDGETAWFYAADKFHKDITDLLEKFAPGSDC